MNYEAYFKAAQLLEVSFSIACVMLYDLQFADREATLAEKDFFAQDINQYKY